MAAFTSVNNDLHLKDGETLAAHSAILDNTNSSIDQQLSSARYEYQQKNSVTTKTSHSVGTELTTTATMNFPDIGGFMSLKVKYDFNHTNEEITA